MHNPFRTFSIASLLLVTGLPLLASQAIAQTVPVCSTAPVSLAGCLPEDTFDPFGPGGDPGRGGPGDPIEKFCLIAQGTVQGAGGGATIESNTEFPITGGNEICAGIPGLPIPAMHTDVWPPQNPGEWAPIVPGVLAGVYHDLGNVEFDILTNSNALSAPNFPGFMAGVDPTTFLPPTFPVPRSARVLRLSVASGGDGWFDTNLVLRRYGSEDVTVAATNFTNQTPIFVTALSGDGERVWREDIIPLNDFSLPPIFGGDVVQFEFTYDGNGSDNGFYIDNIEVEGPGIIFSTEPNANYSRLTLVEVGRNSQGILSGDTVGDEFVGPVLSSRVYQAGVDPDVDVLAPEMLAKLTTASPRTGLDFYLAQDYDEIWITLASTGKDDAQVFLDGELLSVIEGRPDQDARHSIHNMKVGALSEGTHRLTLVASGNRTLDRIEIIDRGEPEPLVEQVLEKPKIRKARRRRGRVTATVRRSNTQSCEVQLFGGASKDGLGVLLGRVQTSRKRVRFSSSIPRGVRVRRLKAAEKCSGKSVSTSSSTKARRKRTR